MSFATFAALSELIIAVGVFYLVISNYKGHGFNGRLAFSLIAFEFFVNMIYMIVRMNHHSTANPDKLYVAFAAIHGSLSLLIFVVFVILAMLAYNEWKKGICYFQNKKTLTWSFLFIWLVSVGSGEILYLINL